jgi:LytS/YehU family sensor histidine kinase
VKATAYILPAIFIVLALLFLSVLFYRNVQKVSAKRRQGVFNTTLETLKKEAGRSLLPEHFIFNALEVIRNMVFSGRTEEAGVYLGSFGKLIRMNAVMARSNSVSLADELEYLHLYILFEQLRFEDRFTWRVEMDPSLDITDIMIPSNLLRPVVEHLIWEHLLPLKRRGSLLLVVSGQTASLLKFELIDDGEWASPPAGAQPVDVLKELKRRVDLLSAKEGVDLQLNSSPGYKGNLVTGNRLSFQLPVAD